MTDIPARPAVSFRVEMAALQLLVGGFLALRLYFDLTADLFGDEAYYWMWGQQPGWSYFDHPPVHAWMLGLVALIGGWHPLSVRLLTWLTLAGVFAIFWRWSKRLAPADPALWFWRTAAIYLSSPLFFGMTMIAYNDHLLVALSLLAIHCFVEFMERHESGKRQAARWLYAAAVALGLAALTKYNGVFVGLGFALTFLLRPKLRAALSTPHPWLAGLLAIAMQTPVLYWNLVENGASFHYHLDSRWGGGAGQLHWLHPVFFVVLTLLIWSPFLLWPLIRLIRSRPETPFEDRARTVTLATFSASTSILVVVSVPFDAYFYWNIVAFVGLMPLLTRLMNGWLRLFHYLFGLAAAVLIVVNFSIIPVGVLFGLSDNGSSINYGWDEIADHMRAAAAKSPTDTIGGNRYSTTAQLGFALGITDAVRFDSTEQSQYLVWQAGKPLAGKSGLILIDEHTAEREIAVLNTHFDRLTEIDRFTISRFGHDLYGWRIYRGDGYRP